MWQEHAVLRGPELLSKLSLNLHCGHGQVPSLCLPVHHGGLLRFHNPHTLPMHLNTVPRTSADNKLVVGPSATSLSPDRDGQAPCSLTPLKVFCFIHLLLSAHSLQSWRPGKPDSGRNPQILVTYFIVPQGPGCVSLHEERWLLKK